MEQESAEANYTPLYPAGHFDCPEPSGEPCPEWARLKQRFAGTPDLSAAVGEFIANAQRKRKAQDQERMRRERRQRAKYRAVDVVLKRAMPDLNSPAFWAALGQWICEQMRHQSAEFSEYWWYALGEELAQGWYLVPEEKAR